MKRTKVEDTVSFYIIASEKFENEMKKIKSKKIINKYITMRDNTLSYLIQNEKEITLKLSR